MVHDVVVPAPVSPLPPPPQNVGVGSAAAAAHAMADLLGSPQLAGGTAQEAINSVLGVMSPMQLFEVAAQMKALAQSNPLAARQVSCALAWPWQRTAMYHTGVF
jgi:hypothetical protein